MEIVYCSIKHQSIYYVTKDEIRGDVVAGACEQMGTNVHYLFYLEY